MGSAERKESLHYLFDRVVGPMGYKFTPDEELADFLLEQEVKLEQDHGAPYCPCQGRTGSARRGHADRAAPASPSTASTSTR